MGYHQLLLTNRQRTDLPFSPSVMGNGFGFALNATKKTDRRRTLKEREMFACTQRLQKLLHVHGGGFLSATVQVLVPQV